MDEALATLIKSGIPLAHTAIVYYYTYWTLCAVISGFCVLGIFGGAYRLVRIWQRHVIERETRGWEVNIDDA